MSDYVEKMNERLQIFYEMIKDKKLIIGYTGGLNSTLLSKLASRVCSEIICVFIETRYTSPSDIIAIEKYKNSKESSHQIVCIEKFDLNENILMLNSDDRDFFCKKGIIDILSSYKEEKGFDLVLDGTAYNEENQFGFDNCKSIFHELKLTGEDLQLIAEKNSIKKKRPSEINLLSRFGYHIPITRELLAIIARSEKFIIDLTGIPFVRLKIITPKHCIIASRKKDISKIVEEKNRKQITETLVNYGFQSIGLELLGYENNN